MAGEGIRTVWDDIKAVLELTPDELGVLRKKDVLPLFDVWRRYGLPRFDLALAWNIAKGRSPYVFIVGEPMSGKTTFGVYAGLRFSLDEFVPEEAYYAGGVEEFLADFIERKKFAKSSIVIDEGEEELDKWWSELVKLLRLVHDLRGLHRRNAFFIIAPDILEFATKLRRMNGAFMVKVVDWGEARTYVIRKDPADISSSAGARRYLLDGHYEYAKPPSKVMKRIYELSRQRKEKIVEETWRRYKEKKLRKEEAIEF